MGTIFPMVENPPAPPGVDPTTPSPARMYDYVLGGVHNSLSHATYDRLPAGIAEASSEAYEQARADWHPRSRSEVERLFADLQIVPPYKGAERAVTHLGLWGAEDPDLADSDGSHWWYGGVGERLAAGGRRLAAGG